jgi:hypothetical protein
MPAVAEPAYNTCYVVRARDASGRVLFAAELSNANFQLITVRDDTPQANAERLGSLTPIFSFSLNDSREGCFHVHVLEIENIEHHPNFQLPTKPINYVAADMIFPVLTSNMMKHFFPVFHIQIMKEIQSWLTALDQPSGYRWFLWKQFTIAGTSIPEPSEEHECFCFDHYSAPDWWMLPCNHCFHRTCIEGWHKMCTEQNHRKSTCPMCRHAFE